MSFASLRRVLRSARKGLCSTCSKARYPQLEAAGAGHVGCLIYTFETLGQMIKDEHDVTAMHVAARKGQISVLIYIVENNLVDAIPKAKNGATPAHDAAGTGHLDCLRYILGHTKASANDTDGNNATPLHWAVQSGHLKIMQWLVVEAHAPIDSMAKNGVTPIHVAAAKNYLEILRWLIGHAYRNHPKPMRLVNARDRNGATPLYHSAHAGNVNISRWLAEKGGGDPTIFSTQGLAPLHAATIAGHFETVEYLFQFGSATAPGGLRTTEGACAVHFAAAEGHVNILKWLLKQKECSGNERDYYQSTPMHDAAEHGHLKIIQVLCDHGADATLTDIEGNTPRDLAEKNGQYKSAKYLAAAMKHKVPRGTNRSLAQGPSENSRGLSRQKHTTKAEMIDSYRNAPPHQLPLNVFDMEDEELEDLRVEGNEQWETLRDLMGEQEIKTLKTEEKLSVAEQRQRKLEEDMRREVEQRKRKRREQLQREQEYEKEIRDRLMAEEKEESLRDNEKKHQIINLGAEKKGKGGIRKRKKSDTSSSTPSAYAQLRRLSLPVNLGSDAQVTQRGLVEKRTKEFESRSPLSQKGSRGILSKLWPKKSLSAPNTLLPHSQSWDSSFSRPNGMNPYDEEPPTEDDQFNTNDEELPEPPPIPTVEYLLGKRAVNLRKRASVADNSIQKETDDSDDYDSDSHSSVGSSRKGHHKKKNSKRRKRKSQGDAKDGDIQWQYNKLTEPQSSPPVKKSLGRQRKLTPIPSEFPIQRKTPFLETMPQPLKLDFNSSVLNEKSKDIEPAALSSTPDTPSSLSPLHSPSPKSSLSPTSPMSSKEASPSHTYFRMGEQSRPARVAPLPPVSLQSRAKPVDQEIPNHVTQNVPAAPRITQPKRPAPKLPPHLQNRQSKQQVAQKLANATQGNPKRKVSPISKIASSRSKSNQQGNMGNTKQGASPTSPNEFMAVLNKAISSSPEQPRIFRQTSRDDNTSPSSSPGTHSPTIDQIELELDAMKTLLESSISKAPQRLPSPEMPRAAEEERDALTSESEESSEYTSSSDSSTSDSEDTSSESSSEDEQANMRRPLSISPRRPIMARNIGMASPRGKKFGGFNRARLLARYPRLLSRKVMRLTTIHEVPEELIHQAETTEEQATIFYRLLMEKKCMKAWRKYMQIMKSAIRKAEKMAQRKKRDVLAKTFYAWIQVRNIAAVEKVDNMEKARAYSEKKLMKKVFEAWLFLRIGAHMPIARSTSLQLLNAEDRYLSWLNEQLLSTGKHVENISESLADGVLMIQALVHASGKNPPKYNPRPKVKLHHQDNWKMAHEFMKTLGINVKGIEPADLANVVPAAIHNMFTNVLKWHEKYKTTAL